jgi:predicted metalloprotease with PDZ domain
MGDQKVAHYKTEPTIISSFSLGYYESQTFQEGNGEIPVTIVDEKGGSPEEVALDVANSFKLYTNLFGGAPYARITVTTGPLKHGQAFQEFIHLPWFEEPMKYGKKLVYLGRAHEVAHAWWGHGVNAKSYHDAWLNEAFANYSSLLYARYVLGKDEALFDKIREWREEILGRSHFGIGSGPTLGSIFLGYRASSRQTPRDYAISTYEKGALVLHMLRMMLIDFTTLQESTFKSLMAEFYQKYKGKSASTDDFQKLTEHYFGSDMTWFFDQWVYGTEIPTLKCTKSVTKNAAGHYDLKLTIEQKDVSRPFKIYLPLRIKYKDGSVFRGRILIDQMKTEYPYEVDSEPEEITFNIMESVLCKIEE